MKEKILQAIRKILASGDDPHKIALACAIGFFVAFFPVFGVHTVMALALAWMFRVSPAITLAATFINNPWTIAPIYGGGLWFGMLITNTDIHDFNINWGSLNWSLFVELVKLVGIPFVAGCLVLGAAAAVAGYFIIRRMVVMYRLKKRGAEGGAL